METRFFEWWCPECPTRVRVQTETDGGQTPDEPAAWQPGCPACDTEMISADVLLGGGAIPYFGSDDASLLQDAADSAAQHAAWLAKIK